MTENKLGINWYIRTTPLLTGTMYPGNFHSWLRDNGVHDRPMPYIGMSSPQQTLLGNINIPRNSTEITLSQWTSFYMQGKVDSCELVIGAVYRNSNGRRCFYVKSKDAKSEE